MRTIQGYTKWGMPCEIVIDENDRIVRAYNYLHGDLKPEQIIIPTTAATAA